jgi:hypothetical protein
MKLLDPSNSISWFRFSLVIFGLMNFIISYLIEVNIHLLLLYLSSLKISIKEMIVEKDWYKRFGRVVVRKKQPKNRYKLIMQDLKTDKTWPWIGRVTLSDNRNDDNNYRY